MGLDVMIKRAKTEDAEEILDLQKLAYQSQAKIYNDYSLPPLTQTLEEVKVDFEDQIVLKATISKRIIGSVRAYVDEETCYIGRLFVHPDFQNRGIGTELMNAIERTFNEAKRFRLFTGHRSDKSIYLYQKLGYKMIEIKRITDGLSIIHMEKASAMPR
ncbi:MAG TPA: GNAT family N-acetyltransferase [Anaerolineae bacterium]|nr:GNAT family N-acetyltransferase [Anaerolineae bacterium]